MLRLGCLLVLEPPNLDNRDARLFRSPFRSGWHVPRYWNLSTIETLSRCMLKAGLALAEVSYLLSPSTLLHSVQYGGRKRFGWTRVGRWFDVGSIAALALPTRSI